MEYPDFKVCVRCFTFNQAKYIEETMEETRNLADDEKDVELFESYIRGGIEILYEKCVATSIQKDDFMENIVGFLEEIKDKYPKEYCF